MKQSVIASSVIAGFLLMGVGTAFAASDYFLKIDGIDGESRAVGHEKSIEVMSWSWGVSNTSSAGTGGGGGAGKSSPKPLLITKGIDKASPLLFKACANGQHIKKAELEVRHPGKGGGRGDESYLKYTFEDLTCGDFTNSADPVSEAVSLNYAKVKMEYKPQDEKGKFLDSIIAGWDWVANKLF
jgi:type VI secretion system secreted protein Hcp